MKTTKVQVENLEFEAGAKVHYGDGDTWLALCGSPWFNVSNDPGLVTCMACLAKLEQRELENNHENDHSL